jgi:hypothetical protein
MDLYYYDRVVIKIVSVTVVVSSNRIRGGVRF